MLRNRVGWDDYFMIQALWAKVRSPDESTQHGCVIVDKDNRIIGQGYNGGVRKCYDDFLPQDRPKKYDYYIHAELNCILNSNQSDLNGYTCYITGPPCFKCLGLLIHSGIKRIVYGSILSTHKDSICKSDPQQDLSKLNLMDREIEIINWSPKNIENIITCLDNIKGVLKLIQA